MPEYKLSYFQVRGRGEAIRMLFEIAGVKYIDERLPYSEWDQLKAGKNVPLGQLPILEVDGERLSQSHTIERYLAKKFGLAGSTAWEAARCDMIVDCVEDMMNRSLKVRFETDPERKEELRKKFVEYLAGAMDDMNTILGENTKSAYFSGTGLTFADVVFYCQIPLLEIFTKCTIEWTKWPKLQNIMKLVESHERIADWIKRRPKTDF